MDRFSNQPEGFKPYNAPPPCPGCPPSMAPDQMGMGQVQQPMLPQPGFIGQTPTGTPAGPQYGPMPLQQLGIMPQPGMMPQQAPGAFIPPSQDLAPITPWNQPIPVTTESLQYMNGFMRTQIGRRVTIEFLIGTNTLVDKTGTLLAVGANYVLINEIESDDILLADFYSIKFIKFYY
jgi:hypothetical protein